jgi:tetratricopeptide (TPR) repeat protein
MGKTLVQASSLIGVFPGVWKLLATIFSQWYNQKGYCWFTFSTDCLRKKEINSMQPDTPHTQETPGHDDQINPQTSQREDTNFPGSHKQKLILTISVIIVVILAISAIASIVVLKFVNTASNFQSNNTASNCGGVSLRKGEYQQAIADCDAAIALDPQNDKDYYNRGFAYTMLEKHEQALADYDTAIALNPQFARSYYYRGLSHMKQKNYQQAMQDFRQITELTPDDPLGWNGVCWAGSFACTPNDVADTCERAVELAPNEGYVYDSRGMNRALRGNYEGAIEDFQVFVSSQQQIQQERGDMIDEETIAVMEAGIARRLAWIEALQAGQNPFDEATLEELR